ncbi:MAG: lipopolysaccharide heptosyltransferase II [Candidatus Omnitrophota bacterium]|nr:lipopolysaccharide heptosyltransferase II [Candidatus Omnitrophota bacterium]
MRTDRIGEVLLSTVAVDAVKRHYREAGVSFVTSAYSCPIVEDREDIAEVIIANTLKKSGWFGRAFQLAISLRKRRFDVSLVMNPHKMLHLACFLAGIPVRAGYDRKWGFLLNRKIKDERDSGEKHEVEYTMDLLRLLGIEDVPLQPRLPVEKEAEESVARILKENGLDRDGLLVAVHPGSGNPAKVWPAEYYAELVRRLSADPDCRVAVVGSKEEGYLAEKITKKAATGVLDLTGELNLKELAALLKKADLFIGNDTGPMHMAAALEVPVIAIFGRNIPGVSPARWRPRGEGHVVFHVDPGCDPCYDADCPYDYRCLRAVTVDDVFAAARDILE